MRSLVPIFAAMLGFVSAAPAAAAPAVVELPKFTSILVKGGATTVVLRHGVRQRVTLIKGSLDSTTIRVNDEEVVRVSDKMTMSSNKDQLEIDPCKKNDCHTQEVLVEVVTPSLGGIAVRSGGKIFVKGPFPRQDNMGVAVSHGGMIDAREMPANNVGASVSDGGDILVRAEGALGASVNNGGRIVYWGSPSVGQSIRGDGDVLRGGK